MQSLPLPSRDYVREHLTIALSGEGSLTVAVDQIDLVLGLYEKYDAVQGRPHAYLQGPHVPESLKAAVRDSYRMLRPGRKLSVIRNDAMQRAERCPFCGLLAPNELDHHLPKLKYPALAIYVLNLVPSCHQCNSAKSDLDPPEPGRQFMHAYLEPMPAVRFLDAVVDLNQGALVVEFRIDPDAKIPPRLLERLTHQFERLHLNDRYKREANTLLVNHATALRMAFDAGGASSVQSFLQEQARHEFETFHANHWSAVLLWSLSQHAPFCEGGFRPLC